MTSAILLLKVGSSVIGKLIAISHARLGEISADINLPA